MPPRRIRAYGPRQGKPSAGRAWVVGLLGGVMIICLLGGGLLATRRHFTTGCNIPLPRSRPKRCQCNPDRPVGPDIAAANPAAQSDT